MASLLPDEQHDPQLESVSSNYDDDEGYDDQDDGENSCDLYGEIESLPDVDRSFLDFEDDCLADIPSDHLRALLRRLDSSGENIVFLAPTPSELKRNESVDEKTESLLSRVAILEQKLKCQKEKDPKVFFQRLHRHITTALNIRDDSNSGAPAVGAVPIVRKVAQMAPVQQVHPQQNKPIVELKTPKQIEKECKKFFRKDCKKFFKKLK